MKKHHRAAAGSVAVATLIAAAFSLTDDTDGHGVRHAKAAATSPGDVRAGVEPVVDTTRKPESRGREAATAAAARPASNAGPPVSSAWWSWPVDGGTTIASQAPADSVTVTVPHRITVTMPRYEGGRPPSATPPAYQPGTLPAVERDDDRLTMTFGDPGALTAPAVDPGEWGTLVPPGVIVE